MAQSIGSRIFGLVIRLMRLKRQMSDPQRVQKILDDARTAGPQPYVMSAKLKLASTVTQTTESGMQVYTFTPAGQPTRAAVLYLSETGATERVQITLDCAVQPPS